MLGVPDYKPAYYPSSAVNLTAVSQTINVPTNGTTGANGTLGTTTTTAALLLLLAYSGGIGYKSQNYRHTNLLTIIVMF